VRHGGERDADASHLNMYLERIVQQLNNRTSAPDMVASIERQIALKEAYLPTMESSDLPEHMKQLYRLSIEDMKHNLNKFKKLAELYK
jgi:hypothetical protein